jgi:hypothetical protein
MEFTKRDEITVSMSTADEQLVNVTVDGKDSVIKFKHQILMSE